MSGIPFRHTPMGHAFITKTAPQAVREIGRLDDGIERFNAPGATAGRAAARARGAAGCRGGAAVSNLSILDEIPEVVRDKVQRALRNITPLSNERHSMGECFDKAPEVAMAPDQEALDELRRICARKGIDADAVIALLSQDH